MADEYRRNHYVPIWYQRRFLLPDSNHNEFYRLDLKPETRTDSRGRPHKLNSVRRVGPRKTFCEDDLYTTNLNGIESREIEEVFFGQIDRSGQQAVDFFASFNGPDKDMFQAYNDMIPYLCMQKFRTPKGLQNLSELAGSNDRDVILSQLPHLVRIYGAIWSECVWSIADASKSHIKFIMSDHPVTVYNEECKPESKWCRGSADPDIRLNGTHTIFPLNLEKLLILTNLSWVRNPYVSPLISRPNPTLTRETIFSFLDIQAGRQLSDAEVIEINYIIKRRAKRYVAAAKKEWLYPETSISRRNWKKLGGGYLLFPDPRAVLFSSQTMMGYSDGSVVTFDEYGRRPAQAGFHNEARRDEEFRTFQAFQGEYARVFGPKRRGTSFHPGIADISEDSPDSHAMNLEAEKRFKPKFARKRW